MFFRNKQEVLSFFRSKSLLSNLIIINIAVWLLLFIIKVLVYFLPPGKDFFHLFIDTFGLSPDFHETIRHPWSIFTFLFIHTGFFNLIFNILILYFSGTLFYQYFGKKPFNQTFFLGGLFGALCYVACSYFAPILNGRYAGMVVGASPAIFAVLFRLVKKFPNMEFPMFRKWKIKLKYLVLALFLLDLLTINGENSGGFIAHIGGAFYGYFSIYFLQLFNKIRNYFKSLSYKKKLRQNKIVKKKEEHKKEKILKKLAAGGYANLTKKEKEYLFKSNNHQ